MFLTNLTPRSQRSIKNLVIFMKPSVPTLFFFARGPPLSCICLCGTSQLYLFVWPPSSLYLTVWPPLSCICLCDPLSAVFVCVTQQLSQTLLVMKGNDLMSTLLLYILECIQISLIKILYFFKYCD